MERRIRSPSCLSSITILSIRVNSTSARVGSAWKSPDLARYVRLQPDSVSAERVKQIESGHHLRQGPPFRPGPGRPWSEPTAASGLGEAVEFRRNCLPHDWESG